MNIVDIAKVFNANVESKMSELPFMSDFDLKINPSIQNLPSEIITKYSDEMARMDGLLKDAKDEDLWKLLETHINSNSEEDYEEHAILECAEIYSKQAKKNGSLQKMVKFLPDVDKIESFNEEKLKEIAPNFLALILN